MYFRVSVQLLYTSYSFYEFHLRNAAADIATLAVCGSLTIVVP